MPCDLLYQDVFTSHNALLVYPFAACLCSWLMFVIELFHCLDTIQFSVASWLVILWDCDSTWYLRSQFSISHRNCPFRFQLLPQGVWLLGIPFQPAHSNKVRPGVWCFHSALAFLWLSTWQKDSFYRDSGEGFCLDSRCDDASLSNFPPVSVLVAKGEMILPVPCQSLNWTLFYSLYPWVCSIFFVHDGRYLRACI